VSLLQSSSTESFHPSREHNEIPQWLMDFRSRGMLGPALKRRTELLPPGRWLPLPGPRLEWRFLVSVNMVCYIQSLVSLITHSRAPAVVIIAQNCAARHMRNRPGSQMRQGCFRAYESGGGEWRKCCAKRGAARKRFPGSAAKSEGLMPAASIQIAESIAP